MKRKSIAAILAFAMLVTGCSTTEENSKIEVAFFGGIKDALKFLKSQEYRQLHRI